MTAKLSMTFDENNPQPPVEIDEVAGDSGEVVNTDNGSTEPAATATPTAENGTPVEEVASPPDNAESDRMNRRLERLGGEPAPVITPEEFARLQKVGQVHIDARGRVRTERPRGTDPGVSLRKRRAWYAHPGNLSRP